ncbi:type IV secretion protein Rhs (plasmid) [Brasilonema octagenarum UFV-E1]|uniref:Type IV secretion protein Rhs n=2 Tax=Brasilonema TaxID=383614 RepID=A0A856MT28_9CYAN|nr:MULTISPECIES: phage baseplate assembly protein V [Brasilonema]NMF62525.1 type IV secretion protein Rhs [Brasilonema octagenarum UFV-OR1]QDL12777.1 type IV secretion protein Rhs [Brasilonema sennae CENA114]QDL19173.1 type IV secretion protein Rhs [Brasilonema octagenarum UFV-E1]
MPAKESLYLSIPRIQLSSAGGSRWQTASPELMKDFLQIIVEESLHAPAMFTLVIHNSYLPTSPRPEYQPWRHEKLFEIGNKVKIGFVSSTTQDPNFDDELEEYLIEGEITGIEVSFNEKSEAPIIVRGYDISHRLHRGRHNYSYLNMSDTEIVKDIATRTGITMNRCDNSGQKHEYVFQENQTHMEFLRERAARIGYELYVQDNQLNFCKPASQSSLQLKWLDEINSFKTRITSAQQVSSVEVRSWDYTQKQAISETATSENVVTQTGSALGSVAIDNFNLKEPSKITVVDQPVSTAQEAQAMAQALCDELGGEFIYADAKSVGNPNIRPGRVVTIDGLGDRYSGEYYVTETRHIYSGRVYHTEFSVRGLRSGSLFSTISTPVRLQPGQTFLVGIVTDNNDPQGMGRVKVYFPTLTPPDQPGSSKPNMPGVGPGNKVSPGNKVGSGNKAGQVEEHESYWARVVAIGAGQYQKGFDCLPEVNDEVLVGFEHGDIHRPYIIGGVWNGKDNIPTPVAESVITQQNMVSVRETIPKPKKILAKPDAGKKPGNVRLRTFETRTGHTLQFIEEDKGSSHTGIRIETAQGHKIYLNDSQKQIEIITEGGHSITMNDSPGKVFTEIKTKGGHSIKMNDSPPKISTEITTQGGHSITMNDSPPNVSTEIRTKLRHFIKLTDTPVPKIVVNSMGLLYLRGKNVRIYSDGAITSNRPVVPLPASPEDPMALT